MQPPQLLIPSGAELPIFSMETRVVEALKNGFWDAASDIQSTPPVQTLARISPASCTGRAYRLIPAAAVR
jgi:hypothetical protein